MKNLIIISLSYCLLFQQAIAGNSQTLKDIASKENRNRAMKVNPEQAELLSEMSETKVRYVQFKNGKDFDKIRYKLISGRYKELKDIHGNKLFFPMGKNSKIIYSRLGQLLTIVWLPSIFLLRKLPKGIEVTPKQLDHMKYNLRLESEVIRAKDEEDLERKRRALENGNDSVDGFVGLDFGSIGGGSGKEAAMIIFAVVGLTIIILWVPYIGALLYKLFTDSDSLDITHSFSFNYTSIETDNSLNTISGNVEEREGSLYEGTYSLLMKKKSSDSGVYYGLGFSVGKHDITDTVPSINLVKNYDATYFMAGPILHFSFLGTQRFMFAELSLLGGSSNHNDIRLMTSAKAETGYYPMNNLYFSLYVGGLGIDVDNSEGLISGDNDILFNWGIKTGISI